jgi:hypothetical protein
VLKIVSGHSDLIAPWITLAAQIVWCVLARSAVSAKTSPPSSSSIAHRRLGSAIRVLPTMTADPAESPKSSTMTPKRSSLLPGYTRTRRPTAKPASRAMKPIYVAATPTHIQPVESLSIGVFE